MSAYKSHLDQELLDCLKSGDERAFAEIYERYWKLMYYHTLKMLGDADDAQDLVQELFASVWNRRVAIPHNTNLSGYLYITARNKIINLIQQKKVRRDYISSLAAYVEETGNRTVDPLEEKELLLLVEREIQNLPVKMRQVFELSRKEFLSHKEIASQLNISDKTVKKQISYAIRAIRLKLDVLTRIILLFLFFD